MADLVDELKRLRDDPVASAWSARPGLEELRIFFEEMKRQGLVIKKSYDLPLPDFTGHALLAKGTVTQRVDSKGVGKSGL